MKTLRFLLLLGSLPLSCPLLYKTNYCSSDQQPTSSLLAAGYFHTCATSSNSTAPTSGQRPIACWGWQEFGQCLTPAGLSDVVLVAAGARHSCAANKEETAKCWGSNVYGQLDLPKPVKSKACVYCKLGEFDSDPLSKNYRYCVVKTPTGSDVYPPLCFFDCILSDSPGLIQSYTPTNVSSTSLTGLRFRLDGQFMCLPLAISAGCHHTCVLYGSAGCTNCNSGFLRCYGSNSHNQSLVPSCPPNLTVTPAVEQLDGSSRLVCPDGSPPLVWLQVSAGMFHTCALTALHRIVCWGSDEYGQSRAPEGLKFKKVSAGAYHSCGITTGGEMLCWGNNQYRQAMSQKDLVTVSNASNPSQSLLAQGGSFIDVACGASHTCAIFLPSGRTLLATQGSKDTGAVAVCWGSNFNEQLAVPPQAREFVTSVSVGWQHSCAISLYDQQVVCWGGKSKAWGNSGQDSSAVNRDCVSVCSSCVNEAPRAARDFTLLLLTGLLAAKLLLYVG